MTGFSSVFFDDTIFELLIRLILGAVAAFLAIISWTRTREISWAFVIAGILASYAGTLYRALRVFGFFPGPDFLVFSTPIGILVSDNLSVICFIIACVCYIRMHK